MVLMAACGLSIKIIVGPLCKLIAVTLLIPVGSVAGAVYMIWPMLSILVVKKIGAASMVGLVQGIVVLITGFFGSHGILSLIIYTIPGVFIDIGFIIIRQFRGKWLLFFPPAMGNVSGSIIV